MLLYEGYRIGIYLFVIKYFISFSLVISFVWYVKVFGNDILFFVIL